MMIPKGVKSIGKGAFGGCGELTSVLIQKGMKSIGEQAFYYCCWLTVVAIPEGVARVGRDVFQNCSGLTSVTIPPSMMQISDYAFQNCSGLTSVTIPSGVTSIGMSAFSGCSELKSITIPSYVMSIGSGAFYNCSGMTSLTISEGVTSIGNNAFRNCSGLTSVTIPSSVTSIGDGVFHSCSGLTSVTIPTSVTSIGMSAFNGCSELKSITIPSSVTSIGAYAFFDAGLTSITILPCMKSIGTSAFPSKLTTVYVVKGDTARVKELYNWRSNVTFVEFDPPTITGDEGATVTGDPVTGFVIRPSEGKTAVEVTIPQGVDAANVTVEVSPTVKSAKTHGANIRIVKGMYDITSFLDVPAEDANGVVDLEKAMVKEEFVNEALDVSIGAAVHLSSENPSLKTAEARPGLSYTLYEGVSLGGMTAGDHMVGNGKAWSPEITVKGGKSGFYSIKVEK